MSPLLAAHDVSRSYEVRGHDVQALRPTSLTVWPGDVVAVWGCGGVGQMASRSAYVLGASRVIAIDFGEIIAIGEPAEIVRHPRVVDAYIGRSDDDRAVA